MKIFFVVNSTNYFISHRMLIGLALIEKGYDVHIVTPDKESPELTAKGFSLHSINMSRRGMNPLSETLTIYSLYKLFKYLKPDLVHLVTIKPYLYGGIAARLAGVGAVVSAVAGLGIVFSKVGFKNKLLKLILYPLYKAAFSHKNQTTIFQNTSDRDLLVNWRVLTLESTSLIRGSGVDLKLYPYLPEANTTTVISFAARLLKDKGVLEFVEASRILKQRNVDAHFWLIGDCDFGNNNTVAEKELIGWQQEGLVKWLGHREEISYLFASSNIVCLPSFYGEGLPKVLIEAAACGRAVVTTDHPGCRDAIEADTGILVPIKNAEVLADALEFLINNPDKRKSMGAAGRSLSEREFSINKIIDLHMEIYQELFGKSI